LWYVVGAQQLQTKAWRAYHPFVDYLNPRKVNTEDSVHKQRDTSTTPYMCVETIDSLSRYV